VSKTLVLLSVFFSLVSLAVEAVSKPFLLAVAPTLANAAYLQAFEPAQLQALAHLALKSHDIAFNIALIFFGCACLVDGYLERADEHGPRHLTRSLESAPYVFAVNPRQTAASLLPSGSRT
jgi:hypothetical protein